MLTKFKFFLALAFMSLGILTVTGSALAKNNHGDRPGWGWGDKNHHHFGPPRGPSVHPVFVEPEISAEIETEIDDNGASVMTKAKVFLSTTFASFKEFTVRLKTDSITLAFR